MNQPRGALTAPIAGKRKERDDLVLHPINGSGNARVKTAEAYPNTTSLKQKQSEPIWSNRLLAGYLAHEFLSQGSLLGEKLDPAGAEATELKKKPDPAGSEQKKGYGEVARILKTEGVHISGIVNPTQLARWIQM